MTELRPYQQESIDAVMDYWGGGGGNPLVDMATGLGKSVVIGKLTKDLVTSYPTMRVLMLVHVRELVEQNFLALMRQWPNAPAGVYSAGLGRRDAHHRITFASIQSVYKRARALGDRHLVLIDEAHLVPAGGDGMYRTLLDRLREQVPDLRVAGFTATPFRMDAGRLDQGGDRLFDETVYSYGIARGIDDGWLSPLISKGGATEIDVSGVAKRGGEFVPGALEAASDKDEITRAAVAEMLQYGQGRKSWLVFCAGVKHAHHVRDALRDAGVSAGVITGETPDGERRQLVQDFKAGRLRALTNAQVLTTGFDAPGVDLIAFLRSTLSTGLYVQMCGRGTRTCYPAGFDPNTGTKEARLEAIALSSKPNCMILDFAGNVRRHGPVDTVMIKARGGGLGKEDVSAKIEDVRAKECPHCHGLMPLNCAECRDCGHQFPAAQKPKHEREAADIPILSRELKLTPVDEAPVLSWTAGRHLKMGAPDSLKVTYYAGLMSYPEWLCFEHTGFARSKAERWWAQHGGGAPPATVTEALARFGELKPPEIIQTRQNGRWFDIVGRRFAQQEADRGAA